LWLVLSLTTWNAARLFTALAWRGALTEFEARPGPIYLASTGAAWMFAGLFLLWSLWRREAWTRAALLGAGGLYAVWVWLDRIFARAWVPPNWPFGLAVTIVLLGFTAWTVLDPDNRTFFQREAYERQPED
jgi:hypothetical protein